MTDTNNEEHGLTLQINTPIVEQPPHINSFNEIKSGDAMVTNTIKSSDVITSTDKITSLDIKDTRCDKNSKQPYKTTNNMITYDFFKEYIYPNMTSSIEKRKKKKIFIYKHQLKNTLTYLKIPFNKSAKKEVLEPLLFKMYKSILDKDNKSDIHKINLIKSKWKEYIQTKKTGLYGPGFIDKTKCKNLEDCFSMESINDTPSKFFFSISDNHNSIFFFDIRTFDKLIKKKSPNPYTREPFNDAAIKLFEKRKAHMETNNISILYQEEIDYINNLTPEQRIKNRIFDIFQIVDELNVMASGTKLCWFNNLDIYQLKKYYKVLEDIWMYRANLTAEQKEAIVPDHEMFTISVNYVYKLTNNIKIKNIILNEMEKLVKSSPDVNHRNTGAYYVLIAFTEVSMECANDMPWLIQY